MPITLDIVGVHGGELHRDGLDYVVIRRRERDFELGSEVEILPRHAPLLMQTCACEMRWRKHGREERADVEPGVLEVWRDHVTLLLTSG